MGPYGYSLVCFFGGIGLWVLAVFVVDYHTGVSRALEGGGQMAVAVGLVALIGLAIYDKVSGK